MTDSLRLCSKAFDNMKEELRNVRQRNAHKPEGSDSGKDKNNERLALSKRDIAVAKTDTGKCSPNTKGSLTSVRAHFDPSLGGIRCVRHQ